MKKIAKYAVKTVGYFGGYGKDVFVEEFDDYEKAVEYYKGKIESLADYYDAKVEFIDGIAKAEKELAELKMKVAELETAIKIARES